MTERYNSPVTGKSQGESIGWLLERAYGQMVGHDESVGGWPEDSYEHLIGADSEVIDGQRANPIKFWDSRDYSDEERQQIIDAVDNSRPVAAETASTPKKNDYWYPTNPDRDGSYMSDVDVQLYGPDGKDATIKIYGAHAYAIVDADENGVTLVNPHGNNPVVGDPIQPDSGTFYMTWDDFEHRFGSVAVGGDYK